MDLSSLSTADLQAIQRGDMSAVSTEGLKAIAAQAPKPVNFGTGHPLDSIPGQAPVPMGSPAALAARSPITDMSTAQRYLAGTGKGMEDIVRGVGQLTPWESRQDVQDSRDRDKSLMSTTAGKLGDLTGTLSLLAPAAFIPGANTMAGAAAIGAGTGLMAPSTSTIETLKNTGLGTVLGPAGLAVGRGIGAAYGLAKGLVEPFLPGGTTRIASRALQNFAGSDADAAAAAARLQNPPAVLPGVAPTTAELASNPGLSQLQRSLQNDPAYLTALTKRNQANRGAMQTAIGDIAGTDAQRAAAEDLRKTVTDSMYRAANNVTVPSDASLEALLQRPSMTKAWTRAQQLANERGEQLEIPSQPDTLASLGNAAKPPTQYTGKTLQYLKMALNDIANTGPQQGIGSHEIGAIKNTLGALNDWTAQNVPKLRMADQIFQKLSQPINQMDVGKQLANTLTPALNDFGEAGGTNAASFARAVRNGDPLAANATGWKGATLANTLSPDQQTAIRLIGEQLARTAGTNIGRAPGSNTVQNMVGQDALRQVLGPLGMPTSWAESVFGRTLGRPISFAAKVAEPDIQATLQEAMLDPKKAASLLQAAGKSKAAAALWQRQSLLAPPSIALGSSLADFSKQ